MGLQTLVVPILQTHRGCVQSSIRLGRIAGIPLGAHWSVVAIIALVTDALATAILPASVKGLSAAEYWIVGTVVAVLFFGCLVAHETAHAVVARRRGVQVKSITLWMLGGVTQLEGNAVDARSDLQIAVVGPAVSALCAVVAGALAGGLAAMHAPAVITAGVVWLAITNGLLALFNMLPGAPLDGGRVLRAFIWWRTGNRDRAALSAARAGRITGMCLVALGAVESVVTTDLISGLWLMLIGWFLVSSATAEMQATVREVTLGNVTVGEVMETTFTWLPAYQQVAVAARRAVDAGAEFYPVCDIDGNPVGIINVDRLVQAAGRALPETRVGQLAFPIQPRMIATPGERLADALQRAGSPGLLMVMLDRQLVGIVTPVDVSQARRRGLLTATSAGSG